MLKPFSPRFIGGRPLLVFGMVSAFHLATFQLVALRTLGAAETASPSAAINVKEYGVAGDGMADDTAPIQKALDGGRRIVVIPAGTYRITAALKVDSGTTIRADEHAVIRLADHAGNESGLFVLTNRDFVGGNADIVVEGGIWDGNNEHNPRGTREQMPCYSGVALNFINVRHMTLRGLTVRNPDAYAIRACHLTDFLFEHIGFDFSVTRRNQDGVHLNGFCEHGVIRDLRALSPYATNDDMVALNADDGAATDYAPQQDMVPGPIRDITVEHLRAESAFTFVRLLSHQSPLENVTVSDVAGGCRFYAINMDRWHFPTGGGNIHHVTLRNFSVRKMPDPLNRQSRPGERPLIHIQTAVQGLRIENFQRNEPDEATAPTLVLDNGAQNRVRLEGLTEAQAKDLAAQSPAITPPMLIDAHTLEMNAAAKVILPSGGFSLLQLDAVLPSDGVKAPGPGR